MNYQYCAKKEFAATIAVQQTMIFVAGLGGG